MVELVDELDEDELEDVLIKVFDLDSLIVCSSLVLIRDYDSVAWLSSDLA
jgi:hypothetical protein